MLKDHDNLTPKQLCFCDYYLRCYNATKAYRMAYPNVKYTTAERDGHRLMTNDKINARITQIRKQQSNELHYNRIDVLRRLIAMFNANVGDYVVFGNHPAVDKNGNDYQRSYLYFKNDRNVDTRLIQSISNGRNGSRVELPDKIKIASLLLEYLPAAPTKDVKHDTLVQAFLKGSKKLFGSHHDETK